MKPAQAAITGSGWSRCGEWPQSGSSSSRVVRHAPRDAADLLQRAVLVVQALHRQQRAADGARSRPRCSSRGTPGRSQMSFQPQKAESGVVVVARQALRRSVLSIGLRVPARCSPPTRPRRRCAAPARPAPATASGKRAACSSAIEPPSLWPNSQGGCVDAAAPRSSAGSTSCAWRCMKSRPQRSSARAAWSGRSRGANRPGRGSRAASHSRCGKVAPHRAASPGPRAGRRAAARRRARGRSIRARCARGRPRQSMLDELDASCTALRLPARAA